MMTTMTEWQINRREDELPLLDALALRVPAAPRALLRQLCKKQRVAVNSCSAQAEQVVRAGETLSVRNSLRWCECLDQSHLRPGQILYEDMQCMVIDKPAGLAVHRALGHDDNLLQRVGDFLRLRGETFRVAPIHRLDIGTSGAVLIGKGRASASQLGKMIMARLATKRYLAMVAGGIAQPGELTSLVPAKGSRKDALTRFRPVAAAGSYTLLELELVTGRRHQIRRQLAEAGWPILGDTRYGGKTMPGLARMFLHCHHLTFQQPSTAASVAIFSPLPEELQDFMRALGFPREFSGEAVG
jgi:RluA family pseudouridine synthase